MGKNSITIKRTGIKLNTRKPKTPKPATSTKKKSAFSSFSNPQFRIITAITVASLTVLFVILGLIQIFTIPLTILSVCLALGIGLLFYFAEKLEISVREGFRSEFSLIREYFSKKGKALNNLLNLVVVIIVVIVSILFFTEAIIFGILIDSAIAFYTTVITISLRLLLYAIDKIQMMTGNKDEYSTIDIVLFVLFLILISFMAMCFLNGFFNFQLWILLGFLSNVSEDVLLSINLMLSSEILIAIYWIYTNKTKGGKKADIGSMIVNITVFIIMPIIFLIASLIYMKPVDLGISASIVISAQGFTSMFSYVFFILFQDYIPSFMIAFMTISAIAVIMAQNLGKLGGFLTGVSIASIAIVPLIIILSAITGSISPPSELITDLGLDRSIAGFIYGIGLMSSYVVVATIIGTFIASARLFNIEWATQ